MGSLFGKKTQTKVLGVALNIGTLIQMQTREADVLAVYCWVITDYKLSNN